MSYQALESHRIPLNKGRTLWTLQHLCGNLRVLPKSYVLPIEFKSPDPHQAAGGFADIRKGIYNGKEVAFKSIRESTTTDDAARLKHRVSCGTFPSAEHLDDTPPLFQERFCEEVVLWKALNHPNILGLIGACRWDNTPDARLTMVCEWMPNGNIMEYIEYNDSQRIKLVWRILHDCVQQLMNSVAR